MTGAVRGIRTRRRWGPRQAGGDAVPARVVVDTLPDVVDLLALAIGAGLTVPAALVVLAETAPDPLRRALVQVDRSIRAGRPLDASVSALRDGWGEPATPLVHALTDHLRYGTPVGPSLERVATDSRQRRRRAAEARARKVPVLLVFPLVLCTLPAFGLLTVAPLVAGTLGSLESPLEAPASTTP